MEEVYTALGILGMFVLRLGVPLLVTAAVVAWLRRLDERWQAEAEAQRAPWRETEAVQPEDADADRILRPAAQPCWMIRRCAVVDYRRCPAYLQPHVPCWETRRQADGMLMERCSICTIYRLRIHSHERTNRAEATQFHRN